MADNFGIKSILVANGFLSIPQISIVLLMFLVAKSAFLLN